MTESGTHKPLAIGEFVPLMALITSLGALSIDAMLPAIHPIAQDLGAMDPNDAQLIITSMFFGFAWGQLLYGPLSDAVGRKLAIYLGIGAFLIGCGLSVSASDYNTMLVGRVIQGVGAASTRIVTMALIRDQYVGEKMARVMSMIMGVFVLVPAIAPALGQGVLMFAGWRMIFGLLAAQAIFSMVWLAVRQTETHPPEKRRKFSWGGLLGDVREVFRHPPTVLYTLAFACMFSNLVGYLTAAPQIFKDLYGVVEMFPLYFSMTAAAIGVGSFVNSKLVERFGSLRVSLTVLGTLSVYSALFVGLLFVTNGTPELWQLMTYLVGAFFCMGPLMGNLNSMAMQPVGHVAGTAAAVVGAMSTFVSLGLGSQIGRAYSGTVFPLGFCFLALTIVAFLVTWRTPKSSASPS